MARLFCIFLFFLVNQTLAESSWTLEEELRWSVDSQALLNLKNESRLSENIKLKANLIGIASPTNASSEEKNWGDISELALKYRHGDVIYEVGIDTLSWGVTDGFNPLDVTNAKNYFDPIHPRKLGQPLLGLNYQTSWFEAEASYSPQGRSPQLPGSQSRWLPREVFVSPSATGDTKLLLPSGFNYQYDRRSELNSATKNIGSLRMMAHLEQLDIGLYTFEGPAPMPQIIPNVTGTAVQVNPYYIIQVNSDVVLQTQDYRQRMEALSLVKSFSTWQLKLASAWTQPLGDGRLRDDEKNESVLATEKTFQFTEDSSLIWLLQYAETHHSSGVRSVASFSQFFDQNLMTGGQFRWRDTQSVTVFIAGDVRTAARLTDLDYQWHWNDHLVLGAKASLIEGKEDSSLGMFRKNSFASLYVHATQ